MDHGKVSPVLAARHDSSSRVQKSESAADKLASLKARVAAAVGNSKAKGGLNVGLHPALEDHGQWKPSKTVAPKFATSIGNARPLEKQSAKTKKPLDLSGPSP